MISGTFENIGYDQLTGIDKFRAKLRQAKRAKIEAEMRNQERELMSQAMQASEEGARATASLRDIVMQSDPAPQMGRPQPTMGQNAALLAGLLTGQSGEVNNTVQALAQRDAEAKYANDLTAWKDRANMRSREAELLSSDVTSAQRREAALRGESQRIGKDLNANALDSIGEADKRAHELQKLKIQQAGLNERADAKSPAAKIEQYAAAFVAQGMTQQDALKNATDIVTASEQQQLAKIEDMKWKRQFETESFNWRREKDKEMLEIQKAGIKGREAVARIQANARVRIAGLAQGGLDRRKAAELQARAYSRQLTMLKGQLDDSEYKDLQDDIKDINQEILDLNVRHRMETDDAKKTGISSAIKFLLGKKAEIEKKLQTSKPVMDLTTPMRPALIPGLENGKPFSGQIGGQSTAKPPTPKRAGKPVPKPSGQVKVTKRNGATIYEES